MKRRILAMLLAIVMLVGNVPAQAFAIQSQPNATSSCITEGCTYGAGHSGECSTFVACAINGCTYASGHAGNCSNYVVPEAPKREKAADATVYVTVSDRGELGMANEEVAVSDINADGKLSVDEALYAAHTAYGKGYASDNGTVKKLWDVETSDVSFFVNDTVISLDVNAETVSDGDYLVASVDQDAANDYDKYSRFDAQEASVKAGESFTLTLTDDAGNALAGMEVGLWNGSGSTTMTGLTTDVDGSVSLTLNQEGLYCVTAKGTVVESSIDVNTLEITSVEVPIIAPVCVVKVSGTAVRETVTMYAQSEPVTSVVAYAAAAASTETDLTWSGGTINLASDTKIGSATLTTLAIYKQGDYKSVPTITKVTQNGTTIHITLSDDTDPSYPIQAGFACSPGAVKAVGNTCTLVSGQGTMNMDLSWYESYAASTPGATATYTINFTIPMGTAHTVTPPTGDGFTFTGADSVHEGRDYTFSVTVNEGYDGTNMVVKVNDTEVTGNNGAYTVEAVSQDLIITVEGVVPKEICTVTLTQGEGYTISGDAASYKGEDYHFTVTADRRYESLAGRRDRTDRKRWCLYHSCPGSGSCGHSNRYCEKRNLYRNQANHGRRNHHRCRYRSGNRFLYLHRFCGQCL